MSTWTLWLLLLLNDGSYATVESRSFTSELICKRAAAQAAMLQNEEVRRVIPACKKTTNV